MTRYVQRPNVVEAWCHDGNPPPSSFLVGFRRHMIGSAMEFETWAGLRPCRPSDWVVRDCDGAFMVYPAAKFETMFTELVPAAPVSEAVQTRNEDPEIRVKRPYTRREFSNGEKV